MNETFCVDTSAWITGERYHSQDVFPALWTALLKHSAKLRTPRQARDELGDGKSGLSAWLRTAAKEIIVTDRAAVGQRVGQILVQFPTLIHDVIDSADPWVLAHAKESGWIVVSDEGPGTPTKPKIPDVCAALGVEHINWMGLLRRLEICI